MNQYRFASASFAMLATLSASHAATLAPHRAYYDLEVKRLDQGNNIAAIKGKLAYEITGSSCDGYAVSYRIANRIRYVEGTTQVIDSHLTSWESGDGLQLDMTQKQYVDAKLNSESRIKVTRPGAGKPGKGEYITGTTKLFETDAAAIFPTEHQLKLIEEARAGQTRDQSLIFEGSDDDKSVKAISFIGAKKSVANLPPPEAQVLKDVPAWPMTISYYEASGKGDDQPTYQASFLMLENGISTDLVLDYGDYALSGTLSKLELLKPEPCN